PRFAADQNLLDVRLLGRARAIEQRVGENPFASKIAQGPSMIVGEAGIQVLANQLRERQRQIQHVARQVVTKELSANEAETDRGRKNVAERHRDQLSVDHVRYRRNLDCSRIAAAVSG